MQKYQITQEVMDRYAAVITQETQRIEMEEETKIFRQMVSAEGQTDLTEYYRNTGKVIDGVERRIQRTGNRKAVRVKPEIIFQKEEKRRIGME